MKIKNRSEVMLKSDRKLLLQKVRPAIAKAGWRTRKAKISRNEMLDKWLIKIKKLQLFEEMYIPDKRDIRGVLKDAGFVMMIDENVSQSKGGYERIKIIRME